jgi:hypothetical protein
MNYMCKNNVLYESIINNAYNFTDGTEEGKRAYDDVCHALKIALENVPEENAINVKNSLEKDWNIKLSMTNE